MGHEMDDTARRLASLERDHRRLKRAVAVLAVIGIAAVAVAFSRGEVSSDRVLRVEEVVIEDPNGTVRARLGGDLPDAVFDGRRLDRGTRAAGLLLYDRRGHERGGYVTFDGSDNVLLTLDAGREGNNRQVAYFIADAGGAAALRIWNDAADHVELRTGADGAWLNAVDDGELVFQRPTIDDPASTEMCAELRSLRERAEPEPLFDACRERMSEEACRLCLEGP
ncbi:MAG: hypothetical protein R3266_11840 [Gemmatimonadota bacterium]|nr:hypothetical protein [Gemmatimonadota bacterium]